MDVAILRTQIHAPAGFANRNWVDFVQQTVNRIEPEKKAKKYARP